MALSSSEHPFMQIKHYIVEEQYAQSLAAEPAYRDTTVDRLSELPMPKTLLMALTETIIQGSLALVSNEPLAMGTHVVVDITMNGLPRPLRALGQVVRSDQDQGKVVDRTIQTYKAGIKVLAVNRDDMRRIEADILEARIKDQKR